MRSLATVVVACLAVVLMGARWFDQMTAVPFGVSIAFGNFSQFQNVHKFGFAPDVDTADVAQDLWDCPDVVAGVGTKIYASDSTVFISGDAAGDTTQTFDVIGLDENGDQKTVSVDLAGLTFTQVGDASSWDRVFRVRNTSAAPLTGNVYVHLDATDTVVDGIPDSPATELLACVAVDYEQTQMTHYTIPRGFQGTVEFVSIGVNPGGASTTKVADAKFMIRDPGGVWRVVDQIGISTIGSGQYGFNVFAPTALRPLTDLKIVVAAVSANDTAVNAHYDMYLLDGTL